MSEIDGRTDRLLDEVEKILKDRFSHYMVVAMDGDGVYYTWTQAVVARGLAEHVLDEIKRIYDDT